jgi:hypothetical protein
VPDLSEPDPQEEMTVADRSLAVEELSSSSLVSAESWQSDRTIRHLPDDRSSAPPDSFDDPTIARARLEDEAPPTTPAMLDRASSDLPPPSSGPAPEGTLVMATAGTSGPYAQVQQGFATTPRAAFPTMPDARHGGGDMMLAGGPAKPPAPAARGNGVLVFVAVAAVSMAIVILTGLLVLAAAD